MIHSLVLQPLFSPSHLPALLLALRSTLFPGNHLLHQTRASPPSKAEKEAIRQQCAVSLLSLLPASVSTVYLGTTDAQAKTEAVETILDVLGDAYCLKHFLWATVELVLVRIMPELAVGIDSGGEEKGGLEDK